MQQKLGQREVVERVDPDKRLYFDWKTIVLLSDEGRTAVAGSMNMIKTTRKNSRWETAERASFDHLARRCWIFRGLIAGCQNTLSNKSFVKLPVYYGHHKAWNESSYCQICRPTVCFWLEEIEQVFSVLSLPSKDTIQGDIIAVVTSHRIMIIFVSTDMNCHSSGSFRVPPCSLVPIASYNCLIPPTTKTTSRFDYLSGPSIGPSGLFVSLFHLWASKHLFPYSIYGPPTIFLNDSGGKCLDPNIANMHDLMAKRRRYIENHGARVFELLHHSNPTRQLAASWWLLTGTPWFDRLVK